MRIVADTCWYIDLDRRTAGALEFLSREPDATFAITDIVMGELLAGASSSQIWPILMGSEYLAISPWVPAIWGRAAAHLRSLGSTIGVNNLWIASIALAYDLPVLTRNQQEFMRVPGLSVITY